MMALVYLKDMVRHTALAAPLALVIACEPAVTPARAPGQAEQHAAPNVAIEKCNKTYDYKSPWYNDPEAQRILGSPELEMQPYRASYAEHEFPGFTASQLALNVRAFKHTGPTSPPNYDWISSQSYVRDGSVLVVCEAMRVDQFEHTPRTERVVMFVFTK
jgi:hypothetical protein